MEMLITLAISGVAIVAVGALSFRQQRFHRDIVAATERLEQLDQATALVPIALRSIAPGEGDIPAGGARDTSLEFRATIATAVVCDSGHGSLVLAPTHTDPPRLASILARPDVGDTAWSLTMAGAVEAWVPRAIVGVSDSTVSCLVGGKSPWSGPAARPSLVLRVATASADEGQFVRITRAWRYSIYRSSDGDWYLGAREWNAGNLRFNTIQPVSGPFVSATAHGLEFRYFDSTGIAVTSGASNTREIALIQVAFRVDSALPGKFSHAISVKGSSTTSIALRNRPQ